MKIEFFRITFEKLKYQISRKSIQWEPSCSMQNADRWTDITKLIVPFRNFSKAPKLPYMKTCVYFKILPLFIVIIKGEPSVSYVR